MTDPENRQTYNRYIVLYAAVTVLIYFSGLGVAEFCLNTDL